MPFPGDPALKALICQDLRKTSVSSGGEAYAKVPRQGDQSRHSLPELRASTDNLIGSDSGIESLRAYLNYKIFSLCLFVSYDKLRPAAMLFESTSKARDKDDALHKQDDPEQPLTCMIFFFASRMHRNIQTPLPHEHRSRTSPPEPTHRMNTLVQKVGMHAAYSPLISKFETFPVEMPEAPGASKKARADSRDQMHDTMLWVKFQSKRAREEWITTREWQEFMQKTENEGVFRRIPHARCARSLKGLMDPIDVLTA